MKKTILACGAAALMMGSLASCSGSSAAPSSFEDSLSQSLGQVSGSQLNMQYNQIPEEMRSQFNKEDLLKGVEIALTTDTSYVQGVQIGLQLAGQIYQMEKAGIKVDRRAVINAYKAAFMADSVADMDAAMGTYQRVMGEVQKIMMQKQEAEMKAEAERKANSPEAKKNEEAGKAFLAQKMKEDPSIKTTASGLAYKVVSEGKGETATPTSRVTVNYKGTLIDGTEFDANDDATFPVGGVIPGFGEGLQLMNEGAHYILYIPGNLAYGVDGTPNGSIGPNDMLVFDVVVKSIQN
nr:FKBP-type peptidyl-prolyl cis-trans isomerase [Bacteroides sp.]